MENKIKKQIENINNSNEKLLLSDVSISVCEHNNLIIKKKTVKCPHCGKTWKVV